MSSKVYTDKAGGLSLNLTLSGEAQKAFDFDAGEVQKVIVIACMQFLRYYQSEFLAKEFVGDSNNHSGGRVRGGGDKWKALSTNYRLWKVEASKKGLKVNTPYGKKKVLPNAPMGVLTGRLKEATLSDKAIVPTKAGAMIRITRAMCKYAKDFDNQRTLLRVLGRDMKGDGGLKKEFEKIILVAIGEAIGTENVGSTKAYLFKK